MKQILFLTVWLSLCAPLFAQSQADAPRYEKIIRTMVEDLKTLVAGRDTGDLVHQAVAALERSEANKVAHIVNPGLTGILSGMTFGFRSEDGWHGLTFGPQFLETYWTGSTAHLCVLVHELWHLRDYQTDAKGFVDGMNDAKEKFWYELDAMHVEADFVTDYLDPGRLSRFEGFVLQSYHGDNLNSLAVILQHESSRVFFEFDALENDYRGGRKTGAQCIAEIAAGGKEVLGQYDEASSEVGFEQYFAYMEAATFKKHLLRTLPLFLNKPSMTWGEVFVLYPDIQLIYDRVMSIENTTNERQSQYLKELTTWWEKDLLARRAQT